MWLCPSSNLRASMLALFWWRWRRRCCNLVSIIFCVSIIVANTWINCLNRVRCAPHWHIVFRSCFIFCKLLGTNDIFVYNILYNIMIKQSSSTITYIFEVLFCVLCFLLFLFACLCLALFFNPILSTSKQTCFVSWLTLFISILWYITYLLSSLLLYQSYLYFSY